MSVECEGSVAKASGTSVERSHALEHGVVGSHVLVAEHGGYTSSTERNSGIEVDCEGNGSARPHPVVTPQSAQTHQ